LLLPFIEIYIYIKISSEKDLIYYAYDIVNYYDDVKLTIWTRKVFDFSWPPNRFRTTWSCKRL